MGAIKQRPLAETCDEFVTGSDFFLTEAMHLSWSKSAEWSPSDASTRRSYKVKPCCTLHNKHTTLILPYESVAILTDMVSLS